MEDIILFAKPRPTKSMKPKKPKVVRDRKIHENRGTWQDTYFTEDHKCTSCGMEEEDHQYRCVQARCGSSVFHEPRGPVHW